jgi:arsenite methyltransferase
VEELKKILEEAGFTDILIEGKGKSDEIIKSWNFGEGVERTVFSAYIKAKKPAKNR